MAVSEFGTDYVYPNSTHLFETLIGCCADEAAEQSVGAGDTETQWSTGRVEGHSAADYTAENVRKTTQQGLII